MKMWPNLPDRREAIEHWTTVSVRAAHDLIGLLAGPPVAAPLHWLGQSKPCRRLLTGGSLPCRGCEASLKLRWGGYIPIIGTQGDRLVVLCGESLVRECSEVPVGALLKFNYSERRRKLGFTVTSTIINQSIAQRPRDIRNWLLHLWGDEELRAYLISE